jgi:hypothetical protein
MGWSVLFFRVECHGLSSGQRQSHVPEIEDRRPSVGYGSAQVLGDSDNIDGGELRGLGRIPDDVSMGRRTI